MKCSPSMPRKAGLSLHARPRSPGPKFTTRPTVTTLTMIDERADRWRIRLDRQGPGSIDSGRIPFPRGSSHAVRRAADDPGQAGTEPAGVTEPGRTRYGRS